VILVICGLNGAWVVDIDSAGASCGKIAPAPHCGLHGCNLLMSNESTNMIWRWLVLWCIAARGLQAGTIDEVSLFRLESGGSVPYELKRETTHVAYYFSAFWCPPCRKATPPLVEEYQRMRDAAVMPVEMVLVSADRTEQEMMAYMENYGMKWPAVKFGSQSILDGYAADGIPHLVIVERKSGKALAYGTGPSEIEKVVAEMRNYSGVVGDFKIGGLVDRYGLLVAVLLCGVMVLLLKKFRDSRLRG